MSLVLQQSYRLGPLYLKLVWKLLLLQSDLEEPYSLVSRIYDVMFYRRISEKVILQVVSGVSRLVPYSQSSCASTVSGAYIYCIV